MLEPARSVERTPPCRFRPPHCPWPTCAQHRVASRAFRYKRAGGYMRVRDGRRVPRFRCHACRRGFSLQSFACSYYLKRPELLLPVAAGLQAGSAHRQIARTLGCAPSTVTRLAARLGRHALLFHLTVLDQLATIDEPVVVDHFETFVGSQDDRLGLATPVGQRSWFLYGLEGAGHRRAGRRSPAQRRRAARRAVRPASGQVRRSFERVLDLLASKLPAGARLNVISDDHPAYPAALARHPAGQRIRHRRYPNPPRGPKGSPRSPEARKRDQALFPVDQLHALIRHSSAHHRRETIAFGRRHNALLERGFLLLVWRNLVKGRSERRPDPTTPAMRLGLTSRPWSWSDVLAKRIFPEHHEMPQSWRALYDRDWTTPAIGQNTRHRLTHAY